MDICMWHYVLSVGLFIALVACILLWSISYFGGQLRIAQEAEKRQENMLYVDGRGWISYADIHFAIATYILTLSTAPIDDIEGILNMSMSGGIPEDAMLDWIDVLIDEGCI